MSNVITAKCLNHFIFSLLTWSHVLPAKDLCYDVVIGFIACLPGLVDLAEILQHAQLKAGEVPWGHVALQLAEDAEWALLPIDVAVVRYFPHLKRHLLCDEFFRNEGPNVTEQDLKRQYDGDSS